ncbi:MAG: hypothetical protein ACPLQO_12980, partial [Desulfotomaculales bacterium]
TDARWGLRHPLPVARRAVQDAIAVPGKAGTEANDPAARAPSAEYRPSGAPFPQEAGTESGLSSKPGPPAKGKAADSGRKGEPACSS